MSMTTHHFLHCDIVGKQLGDDISIGQKYITDGLGRGTKEEQLAIYHQVIVICIKNNTYLLNFFF